MVTDTTVTLPAPSSATSSAIDRATRADENVYFDAQALRRGALRRPHADEPAPARRRLPARLPAGVAPRRSSRRSALNGAAVEKSTSPRSRWGRAAVAAPRARRRRCCTRRRRRAARSTARAEDRSRPPAPTASCAGCSRCACPSSSPTRARATRGATPTTSWRSRAIEARARRAGRDRGRRGLRPRPAQAHGLQGRVRGRAPAPRRRSSGRRSRAEFGDGRQGATSCSTRRCCARWA